MGIDMLAMVTIAIIFVMFFLIHPQVPSIVNVMVKLMSIYYDKNPMLFAKSCTVIFLLCTREPPLEKVGAIIPANTFIALVCLGINSLDGGKMSSHIFILPPQFCNGMHAGLGLGYLGFGLQPDSTV